MSKGEQTHQMIVVRAAPRNAMPSLQNRDAVVSTGAQAGKVHLPDSLPIAPGELAQTIGQSFTEGLHVPFATAGVALLCAGLFCVMLLRHHQPVGVGISASEHPEKIVEAAVEIEQGG